MKVVTCRPLVCLTALATSLCACSEASETASAPYQDWAEKVATIPLSPKQGDAISHPTQVSLPLDDDPQTERPRQPLKVELMSPHQLWDVRDGPLKVPNIEVAEGTTRAVLVSDPGQPAPTVTVTPAPRTAPEPAKPAPVTDGTAFRTVQLGAYSSEQAARTAWNRLSTGANGSALSGLAPQFEPTEVGGRQLVRLRVSAREDRVHGLCQTVASSDPWCARAVTSAVPSTIFH